MNKRALRADLLLLLTAMIWGAAFVAQSVSMDHIGPFTFLFCRSVLGGVVLLPVIAVSRKPPEPQSRRTLLLGGLLCGLALFAASALQQIGLRETTAGKAGFLTSMYTVFVPVCGVFLDRRVPGRVWGAVAAALAGMYFLCLHGGSLEAINRGDLLELACALGFTVHILVIDRFSGRADGIKMSCIQFFVCAAVSLVCMLLFEDPSRIAIRAAWLPIAYAGILSSGVGYTLQIVAQKDTDPTVASLLMSLESVFSLIAGWLLLHQSLTGWELLGCALIFAAVVWVQIPPRRPKRT